MPRAQRPPQIHKFGGASIASAAAITHAVSIVRVHRKDPLVVVVSALGGVTDALFAIAAQLQGGGGPGLRAAIDAQHDHHADIARTLFPTGARRTEILKAVDEAFQELERLVTAPTFCGTSRHARWTTWSRGANGSAPSCSPARSPPAASTSSTCQPWT
jgi:aspartokinase